MLVFVFPLAMVYAAVCDAVRYEVPNWLSVLVVVVFLAHGLIAGLGMATVGWHLTAGAAVLLAGWGLFAAGIVGGADAKLLAATATWVGWAGIVEFAFAVAMAGGLLALAIVALRRMRIPPRWARQTWIRRLCDAKEGIPYCVAIGFAGLWVFPNLPVVARWAAGPAGGFW